MEVLQFYQTPAISDRKVKEKCELIHAKVKIGDQNELMLETEFCYYVEVRSDVTPAEKDKLLWVLAPTFGGVLSNETVLNDKNKTDKTKLLIEIGPRLNFSTAFSTNAVAICNSIGVPATRIERSVRYLVTLSKEWDTTIEELVVGLLHDKMTECRYVEPITSFNIEHKSEPWFEVDVLKEGVSALANVSKNLGLAFDEWDLNYYTQLFREKLKRNPTSVECFDLAQSNSEHSRHWFFKGRLVIDKKEVKDSLFDIIMKTQNYSNSNNVIKFSDNSSAIEGFEIKIISPTDTDEPSYFKDQTLTRHIIFTAETHNFPTGVAPFSGATTGTGGRIRDVHAAGRGAHVIAGTAGYSFGNLNIPGYVLPWEDFFEYPSNFALPVDIAVEASNGASDYGNKFGEPIISGFARSFGMNLPNQERQEYIKPIMFTGGIGCIDHEQTVKLSPNKNMAVVKIGGPVYRIGVGGGAASSVHVQGDQKEELDFGAVQRGDAEMEQKLNRVIRACVERGRKNIICSIHDQGAGGNGNVLKEIVDPAGAIIYASQFQLGDPTINILELWGAEYQESDAILVLRKHKQILQRVGIREKCPISFVGDITEDGKVVLVESVKENAHHPVNLELKHVLASMPRKVFEFEKKPPVLLPLVLPDNLTLLLALERVLRLPSVASKRYLTNKVDRSVTGLVAQQQCVGPLHTPLADVAVIALSFFETVGSATSIGEQPIKGLVNAAAGARMSVAEAITNLVFAKISSLADVKCSGNWMWAAKLPGEGAALYDACKAMCDVMKKLGIAIDGGKDSLSMAARVSGQVVKSPGTLVISAYAPCPDIRLTVTPDLKCPNDKGILLHVDVSNGKARLGGTAFAQCFKQLGDESPDLEEPYILRDAFQVIQDLISECQITAGHDISDGGFITCVLEMAFAGNCGIDISVKGTHSMLNSMFAEEVGWVLETSEAWVNHVISSFKSKNIPCQVIGSSSGSGVNAQVSVQFNGEVILKESMTVLRDVWEDTSFQLELRQTNNECVTKEKTGLPLRTAPSYSSSIEFAKINYRETFNVGGPRVAVIREEGINGDREMIGSLFKAGFVVWDVTMSDLLLGYITLEKFRGVVFPGGFSYADVLGSARGWAAGLLFHPELEAQFAAFRNRKNTFSLGVCNGCQLMAHLGWIVPEYDESEKVSQGVVLQHNLSERFESRFVTVKIVESPSIMLKGLIDSILGVWVAHGEGRFVFKNDKLLLDIQSQNLTPVLYVNDSGLLTNDYPFNPNGSVGGIAAICSQDGRHLAMMPHPERCVLAWQWPWMPQEWRESMVHSPWLEMFNEAYNWCNRNP